jgi:hypothetical protein
MEKNFTFSFELNINETVDKQDIVCVTFPYDISIYFGYTMNPNIPHLVLSY